MPVSAPDQFLQAVAAYQAGRLEQAGDICRAVLKNAPGHAACLHLMGVIEHGLGRPAEAEKLIRQSLALDPGFAEMHYSFALVLAAQDKHAEALAALQRVLALKPHHAEAHFALGNAFRALGQWTDAGRAYAQAIALKPAYPAALNSLGVLFCEQKKFTEAIDCLEQALALRPAFPEALNNLGVACHQAGKFAEAARHCERAVALQPDYAAAFSNLGNALKAQGKGAEAVIRYERALAINPDLVEACNNLGLALMQQACGLDQAESHFRQILARYPDHVAALTHLGIARCHRGAFEDGIACYKKALRLQPDYRDALNNLGNALKAVGRLPEAIAAYEQVVAAQPDDSEGRNNLAMALLADGRFDEGWRTYEWRWQTPQLAPARRDFSQPQWRGEAAAGKILLIHAEQGFGDTLQFCRYAALAAARGIRVVLEVQPELVRLMDSLAGVETIVGRGKPLPDFDLHCPMLSLPLAFGTQPETIPAATTYLAADKEAAAAWRKRMPVHDGLNIGLAWAGNPRLFSADLAAADRRRSLPPAMLMPLAHLAHARFYSLQKDGPKMPDGFELIDFMPACRDFADTAALIANLDLVISIDSAVAHLAAALGRPVWLLNRYDSCWRWFMEREDSPWYPTLRLFRQPRAGDWASVMNGIAAALDEPDIRLRNAG